MTQTPVINDENTAVESPSIGDDAVSPSTPNRNLEFNRSSGFVMTYPRDLADDYIMITSHEYRSRPQREPGGGRDDLVGPAANVYRLPVPDLPNLVSTQKFGTIEGALNNAVATGLGEAYSAIDAGIRSGNGTPDVGGIADRLKAQVTDSAGSVVREMAAGVAGKLVGINSIQFQTLATGEVSNPNIELLYAGPTLRTFAMNWTFAPKSMAEAQSCYDIIQKLKQDHLPSQSGNAGMLKVPRIFKIRLIVGGVEAEFYQKYMTCVLESVGVNQNSQGNHMTLPNGAPVISTLSTVWKEIRITTSEDFEDNI